MMDRPSRTQHPGAHTLTIVADGGGSNGYWVLLWKAELQSLAAGLDLTIPDSHLPRGTSWWNTIEHRRFSVLSRAGRWHASKPWPNGSPAPPSPPAGPCTQSTTPLISDRDRRDGRSIPRPACHARCLSRGHQTPSTARQIRPRQLHPALHWNTYLHRPDIDSCRSRGVGHQTHWLIVHIAKHPVRREPLGGLTAHIPKKTFAKMTARAPGRRWPKCLQPRPYPKAPTRLAASQSPRPRALFTWVTTAASSVPRRVAGPYTTRVDGLSEPTARQMLLATFRRRGSSR